MRQLICDSSSSATLLSAEVSLCRRKLGERKRKRGRGGGGARGVAFFWSLCGGERLLLVAHPQIGSAYAKEGTMT